MINSRSARRRLVITVLTVFALVGVFIVRLVDLQVVRADELSEAAAGTQTTKVITFGTRGSIVDSNGVVLADSVERYDITASPENFAKSAEDGGFTRTDAETGEKTTITVEEAVGEISEATGVPVDELTTALTEKPEANFAYLVKKVKLDVFKKVKALRIPWVYDDPHPARTYPSGAIAGNLVGFLGSDNAPLTGTEYRYDDCLSASNGSATYEVSRDGVRLPGSQVVTTEASDGGTVQLTIDSDLNWYAQQALAEQGTAIGADWGTAMVVDVTDGKIRAAADWPSVDPNDLNSVDGDSLGSRIFTAPYEPGSIMKPATFASLLDTGKITETTPVVVPPFYTTGLPAGAKIKDAWAHDELHFTAAGILMNSSNIGTSILSERLDVATRSEYLRKFGFGTKTDVGFLGEESGLVKSVEQLDPITDKAQQFGQGMTATSAQMASLYQTLGNGGVKLPLQLVEGCTMPDGTVVDVPAASEGTRVVSEAAADSTLAMMETVNSQGALKNVLTVPGYRIANKTGTAQVADSSGYGTDRIVSVAGVFPVEDPKYAIVVTFGKPDTMKTSAAAAPTFAAIAKQVIKTYRVTPSTVAAPYVPLTW